MHLPLLSVLVVIMVFAAAASAQDLYCGEKNCYDRKL